MAPKSIFSQPGARHFQLVHRSQRNPLIHDPEASQHVLKAVSKGQTRADLERALAPAELAAHAARANIGAAAAHGVYVDDTAYDYMQHLHEVGLREDGVVGACLHAAEDEYAVLRTYAESDDAMDIDYAMLRAYAESDDAMDIDYAESHDVMDVDDDDMNDLVDQFGRLRI